MARSHRPDWGPRFIESFRASGNVRLSAASAGIDRDTVYKRAGRDPGFAAAWAQAREDAIDGLEAALTAGDNRLTINLTGDNKMPYMLNVSYRTLRPESSKACPVRLTTKLAHAKVKAGETVALTAELTNTADAGGSMMATYPAVGNVATRAAQLDPVEALRDEG